MQSSDYSDVFVSYRRKNVEFVKQLVDELRAADREVWIDWEDIPPGSTSFADDIKRGLEGADAFIAVLTPDYLESRYCVELEMGYAVELQKKIIPIVLQKFDNKDKIPDEVRSINWIYFTPHAGHQNTFSEAFPKVIQALDLDIDHAREHSRLQLRALDWDNNQRRVGYLLSGDELTVAESWISNASNKVPNPTPLHAEYITTSRQIANQRQRTLLATVSVALFFAIVLAVFAFFQYQTANQLQQAANLRAEQIENITRTERAQRLIRSGLPFLGYFTAIESVTDDIVPPQSEEVFATLATDPGGKLRFTRHGENTAILSALYMPDNTVYSGDMLGRLFHWDTQTGETLSRIVVGSPVTALAHSPDWSWLVYGTADGEIILLDPETKVETPLPVFHNNRVYSLSFSADGSLLLSASKDTTLAIWDMDAQTLITPLIGHTDTAYSGVFFNQKTQVASISRSGELCVWDVASGRRQGCFVVNGRSLATGQQPNSVIVGTTDGAITEIDLLTGNPIRQLGSHNGAVTGLLLQPELERFISVSVDNTVVIRTLPDGIPNHTFFAHTNTINTLSLNPNNQQLVTVADDGLAIIWDTKRYAGSLSPVAIDLPAINPEQPSRVRTAVYQPNSENSLLAAFDNTALTAFDVNNTPNVINGADAHTGSINELSFAADGSRFVTASSDWTLRVWENNTPGLAIEAHTGGVLTAKFHPEGSQIVSGGVDNRAIIWDAANGIPLVELIPPDLPTAHDRPLTDVEFSPNGNMVMTASIDGSIHLWNASSGEHYHKLIGHFTRGRSVAVLDTAFNADGTLAISGGRDNTLVIWDVATGSDLMRLSGHTGAVHSVGFTANGMVFSASNDGTLGLWDTTSGARLRTIRTGVAVEQAQIHPDGQQAIVITTDGQLLRWRISSLTELIDWTRDNRFVRQPTCEEALIFDLRLPDVCQSELEGNTNLLSVLGQIRANARLLSENRIFNAASQITREFEGADYATFANEFYGVYSFAMGSQPFISVVETYVNTSNSAIANEIQLAFLQRVRDRDPDLVNNETFIDLLIDAASEQAMQEAQDRVARTAYWDEIMAISSDSRGIETPLGRAMMFDIGIQFGSRNSLINTTEERLGLTPNAFLSDTGVSEQEFLLTLAEVRRDSLYRIAERTDLSVLRGRGDFWLNLIQQGDWDLEGNENGQIVVGSQIIQVVTE